MKERRLGRLAHFTARYRWPVIVAWIVLTVIGGVAAGKLSSRWYQSTAIPGKPAYETGQRTLKAFGAGVRTPDVVVFHSDGDVTKSAAIRAAIARVDKATPGALTSSYFSTGSLIYVSRDRHTTFEEVYLPGRAGVDKKSGADKMRAIAARGLPSAITVNVTGRDALDEANNHATTGNSSALVETLIGGLGAMVILLFVFGTLPAILMPLVVAMTAILNTFTLVWALTYITNVSIIVLFLIGLVGLGVAIDYALLIIFRFRDELREGNDVESALVETMTHAGHSVIVSGTTVAVGLLAMTALPLPLLRGMGIGGMLIPLVSVTASLTLLPAMLSVLGQRINSVRVMPRRFTDQGHPEEGAWGRWARFVLRRPVLVAAVGLVLVAIFAGLGTRLNPNEAQLKYFPGTGTAIAARAQLAAAGISPGVMKPLNVLVENGGSAQLVAAKLRAVPGVVGATAPSGWHRGSSSFVEGFAAIDGAAPGIQAIVDRANASLEGTNGSLTGIAATDRDFLHALFGSFPYAVGLVLLLTLILLTRAFRSVVLAVKAVVLNLLSLAAAFGIIVFVFQQGARRFALGPGSDPFGDCLYPRDDLRVLVRSLDGLRGVHARPHAGGLRRDRFHRQGDRARPGADRQARHQWCLDLGARVPRALVDARLRGQIAGDRAGGRDHLRRHRDPSFARAGADEALRQCELVDARLARNRSSYFGPDAGG